MMEKSIEATGKTIDAAIESALETLGADRDRVSIEVLEKPKPGFLGLGGTQARIRATLTASPAQAADDYLRGLLPLMHSGARPNITEEEDGRLSIELVGEGDLGLLIGRRGETLDAIQHLTNHYVNRCSDAPLRVTIDVENYRQKRVESLERLAHKVATKVLRDRRNIVLEPMNAFERHVIHVSLQDRAGVTTFSTGLDPNRQVVVACERQPRSADAGRSDRSAHPVQRPGDGRPAAGRAVGQNRRPYGPSRTKPSRPAGGFSRDAAPDGHTKNPEKSGE